jgi:predicted anti-sigma-YlaC factor YlaD
MSECERIEQLIERWIDDELKGADEAIVRAHLGGCGRCRAAQRDLEQLGATLESVLVTNAPKLEFAPFWRGIEQRLHDQIPWHQGLLERARGWFGTPRAAWAIPTIIAVLIGVLSYESYLPIGRPRNHLTTVESIDSHGRSVALLREDESRTTVIWLYQNPEDDDEAAEETPQPGPAF